MKKLLYVLALILIFAIPCYGDDATIYERSITIVDVGTDAPSSKLIDVDMGAKAGVIVGLEIDTETSDDWQVYIFDIWYSTAVDNATTFVSAGWWHDQTTTCVENETVKIWDYDSSVTSMRDDDTIWFTNDDVTQTNNIYIGVYNDDPSYTADFAIDLKWQTRKHRRQADITE